MKDLEQIEKSLRFIEKLARGINPYTNEKAGDNDVLNDVRVASGLFFVSDILKDFVEAKPAKSERPTKSSFYIAPGELEDFAFFDEPCSISSLVRRINDNINDSSRKKLVYNDVASILAQEGILEIKDVNGSRRHKLTSKGEQFGFSTDMRSYRGKDPVPITVLDTNAQAYVISLIIRNLKKPE